MSDLEVEDLGSTQNETPTSETPASEAPASGEAEGKHEEL